MLCYKVRGGGRQAQCGPFLLHLQKTCCVLRIHPLTPPTYTHTLLLSAGSGNVDTQSEEQPQKPQESPQVHAGREGEVQPWNAQVSHLFTS